MILRVSAPWEAVLGNQPVQRSSQHSTKVDISLPSHQRYVSRSYVNGMTPPYVLLHVHVIRNVGHFVGFDVMEKLIQFVKNPSQDTNFAGKSKEVKGLEPKTVTADAPTVHFCTFHNLHAAIQSQLDVLQKFFFCKL